MLFKTPYFNAKMKSLKEVCYGQLLEERGVGGRLEVVLKILKTPHVNTKMNSPKEVCYG